MHELYVSEGIVLGKRNVGEANVVVSILTRENGLIKAHVRSARVEKSKLRYGLEPLTKAKFTFVRGRHEWRLTGALGISRELIVTDFTRRKRLGRVTRLLLRLIQGEEVASPLYDSVLAGLSAIVGSDSERVAEDAETILVLRILSHLGYIPRTPELSPFVESDFFSPELIERVEEVRRALIRTINNSLTATGL